MMTPGGILADKRPLHSKKPIHADMFGWWHWADVTNSYPSAAEFDGIAVKENIYGRVKW
jgi:hypothetical protein